MIPVFRLHILIVLIGVNLTIVNAQDKHPQLLKEFLISLENKHQVTFLYDSDLLNGIKVAFNDEDLQLEEVLTQLREKTIFEFEKSGSNILVKPRVAGYNLSICGTVVDGETDEVLPGVLIYNSSKTVGKYSDENGNFLTYVNLADTSRICFYTLGYEVKALPAEYFNGKDCQAIRLKPSVIELEEVAITAYLATGINYRKDNSIEVKPNGMGLLPGETDADILMAIDALPGINTPDSKAGNLNIRGSSPDQTLIVFDNIPIYHKGHYFGTFSPYNPNVVENVVVQRGAYMADKGGRVGGAIEINSKKNIPDSLLCGVSVAGTYGAAYTHIPLVKNKLSLLLAGRSSYPSSWISPKLKSINEFIYQESDIERADLDPNIDLNTRNYSFSDYNVKLSSKPGKKDELNASFLFIRNKIVIEITDYARNIFSYDDMMLDNHGYSLEWVRKWSPKVSTRVTGVQSLYSQSYSSRAWVRPDSSIEDAFYKNQVGDVNLKAITTYTVSEKSSFNFGYDIHLHNQKYFDQTVLSTAAPVNIKRLSEGYLHSLFANYTLSSHSRYIINAGLRANHFTLEHGVNLEPRFLASYFVNDHLTLKTSAGIYNQYVMQISGMGIRSIGGIENLFWMLGNGEDIPVVHSKQVMAGGIYKKKGWVFDVETYVKDINNISVNNFVNRNSPNRFLYGNGYIVGIDFLVKKEWNKLDTWVSYTLSESMSKFDSINLGREFPSVYDQTHVLDVVAAYKWRQWRFSAGWKYRTGLAVLPGIRTPYLQGPPPTVVTAPPAVPPGSPLAQESATRYTDRYPSFHQLDLSIVYVLPKKKKQWYGTIGLSILNVYNRQNVFHQLRRPGPGGALVYANKYAIGFAPNLVLSVNW